MAGSQWGNFSPAHTGELAPGALSILTPREEEVILLRLQSLKYREIGEQLGISSKSVCTLLARALKKLKASAHTQQFFEEPDAAAAEQEEREVPNALR